MRYKGDDKQRYACDEKSDDVRHQRELGLKLTENMIGYRKQGYEDNNIGVYQLSVPIHEKYHDQRGHHQAHKGCVQTAYGDIDIKSEIYYKIDDTVEKLDYRVTWRDPCTATVAFSAKHTPAYDRYEVTFSDRSTAGHAVRILLGKAFADGQTVYAHIQKAADTNTEKEHEQIQDEIKEL